MVGSLTVHVLDDDGDPIEGKSVFCNFVSSFIVIDTHSEELTNEDGVAEFDDVPVGKVEVIVDGTVQVEVSVGKNDHEDVTVTV